MKCIIGSHSSISKGILEAVKYTHHIGGNTTQIFLGSNQSSSLKTKRKVSDEEVIEIKQWLKENDHILIIHSIYLLNFCNFPSDNHQIKYAQDNLIYDLELTEKIGGIGCVLHIGYQKDLDEDIAYANMADNVMFIINKTANTAKNTKIILETPAGKGSQIGTTLQEFARLWKMFPKKYHKRLGVCIDTAHIFSSGEDIRTKEGVKNYLTEYDKLIGKQHLSCFHINDSKQMLNSRKDQHEGLGEGYIFGEDKGGSLDALKEIWKFSKTHLIPMILETHSAGFYKAEKDDGKYYQEISLFRDWDNNINKKFKLKNSAVIPPISKKIKPKTSNKKSKSKKHQETKQEKQEKQEANKTYLKYNTNTNIVNQFEILQKYYKIKNDNIRSNAYQKAVFQLRKYPNEITKGEQVKDIDGIGAKLVGKIDEIIETGALKKVKSLNAINIIEDYDKKYKSPILDVLGFGPTNVQKLKKQGIQNINNLRNAEEQGKIDLTQQQKIGLAHHNNLAEFIPREESKKIKDKINRLLKANEDFKDLKVTIAGSYPSGKETSKDIDIIISTSKYKTKSAVSKTNLMKNIITYLIEKGLIIHNISLGKTKFLGLLKLTKKSLHRHIDILLVPEEEFMFAYLHYTSGVDFNKIIRTKAKQNGFKLNESGLFDKENKKIKITTEKELFITIGMDYIPLKERR